MGLSGFKLAFVDVLEQQGDAGADAGANYETEGNGGFGGHNSGMG
jgi:hypothetical protein